MVDALVVVLEVLRCDLCPIVTTFAVLERSGSYLELPRALCELLDAAAELLDVRLDPLAQLEMFVDLIRLLLLKRHELGKIHARNDIDSLTNLVMNQHWQGPLDETMRLENAILQGLQLRDFVAKPIHLFQEFSLLLETLFDLEYAVGVDFES